MTPIRAAMLALVAAAPALAGANTRPTDDYGIEFVKIGRPHNRAALASERHFNDRFENLGRVNHRYRLSRTEITATQWVDFINAYDPFWIASGGSRINPGFTGGWMIMASTLNPNSPAGYVVEAQGANVAIAVKWRVAAAFCNWLHNGKVNDEWAFQTGAYDTTTFAGNLTDGYTDQATRSPGARFWIPSVDEWVKAAHYDPSRYGEDAEGYWLRKGGQNEPLTPGLPENGGQTSAGNFLPGPDEKFLPVGIYEDIGAPWGVLDISGGVREWTETVTAFFPGSDELHTGRRFVLGSEANNTQFATDDLIDWFTSGAPAPHRYGIRLASAIPAPGAALITWLALTPVTTRRRMMR